MASQFVKLLAFLQLVVVVSCITTADLKPADIPPADNAASRDKEENDLDTDETGWLIQEKLRQLEYIKNKAISPFLTLKSPSYVSGGASAIYSSSSGGYPIFYNGGKYPNYFSNLGSSGKFSPKYHFSNSFQPNFQFEQLFNSFRKGVNSYPSNNWQNKGYSGGVFRPYKVSYAPDCYYFTPSTGFYTTSTPAYSSVTPPKSQYYSYSSSAPYQAYGLPPVVGLSVKTSVKASANKFVVPEQSYGLPSSPAEVPSSSALFKSSLNSPSSDNPPPSGASNWQTPTSTSLPSNWGIPSSPTTVEAPSFPSSGSYPIPTQFPYNPPGFQIPNSPTSVPANWGIPSSPTTVEAPSFPSSGSYPIPTQFPYNPPGFQIPNSPPYVYAPGNYPTTTPVTPTDAGQPFYGSFHGLSSPTLSPSGFGGSYNPQLPGPNGPWQSSGSIIYPQTPSSTVSPQEVTPSVRVGDVSSQEVAITPPPQNSKSNIDANPVGLKFGISQEAPIYYPGSNYALSYYPNVFYISNGQTVDKPASADDGTKQTFEGTPVAIISDSSLSTDSQEPQSSVDSSTGLTDVTSSNSASDSQTSSKSSSQSAVTNFYSTSTIDQTRFPIAYPIQDQSLSGVFYSPAVVPNVYPVSFRYQQDGSPVGIPQGVQPLPFLQTTTPLKILPTPLVLSSTSTQLDGKKEGITVTEIPQVTKTSSS